MANATPLDLIDLEVVTQIWLQPNLMALPTPKSTSPQTLRPEGPC